MRRTRRPHRWIAFPDTTRPICRMVQGSAILRCRCTRRIIRGSRRMTIPLGFLRRLRSTSGMDRIPGRILICLCQIDSNSSTRTTCIQKRRRRTALNTSRNRSTAGLTRTTPSVAISTTIVPMAITAHSKRRGIRNIFHNLNNRNKCTNTLQPRLLRSLAFFMLPAPSLPCIRRPLYLERCRTIRRTKKPWCNGNIGARQ